MATRDCPLCAGTSWTLDLGVPDGPSTMEAGTATSGGCAMGTFGASSWLPCPVPTPAGGGGSCHGSGRRGTLQGFGVPPSRGTGIEGRVTSRGRRQVLWEPSPWHIRCFLPDFTYKTRYMREKNSKNVRTSTTELPTLSAEAFRAWDPLRGSSCTP